MKFAVVSCANYPNGFFNVYREIAGRSDLDAVLHLGDYIYEYGANGYACENAEALGRISQPENELRTLQDYRQRHAQYKSDPDSQAMLASLPLIAVWDDQRGRAFITNFGRWDRSQRLAAQEPCHPDRWIS